MALFTLTDIKFRSEPRSNTNPLSSDKFFGLDLYKYPEDLGSLDKGHYVLFEVNAYEMTNESYKCVPNQPTQNGIPLKKILDATLNFVGDKANELTKGYAGDIANTVRNNIGGASQRALQRAPENVKRNIEMGSQFIQGVASEFFSINSDLTQVNIARKTIKTPHVIALYMPDTLGFNQRQIYDTIYRGSEILTGTYAAIKAGVNSTSPADLARNLSPFIGQLFRGPLGALSRSPDTIAALFAQQFGAVNPRMEMIYSRPEFRSFSFQFMFYPRSEKEAKSVQQIIQKFKFHQSPEIKSGTAGQFLVPPSDFNIKFFYNGQVNDNIPKIKGACILEGIDVDYAPDGFRAYESFSKDGVLNPQLGKTGMPVGIRMTLNFREIEMMTKDAYKQENDV